MPLRTGPSAYRLLSDGPIALVDAAASLGGQPADREVVVPMILLGLGIGSSLLPLNITILAGITAADAGAASSVASAMQWVGGSLGISVLVSAFGAATRGAASAGASSAAVFSVGAASAFGIAVGFIAVVLLVVAVVIRVPGGARRAFPAHSESARRDAPHVELA